MRAWVLSLAAAMALVSCSDPVEDAERELKIVQSSFPSKGEICAAKRKLAAAYLQDQRPPLDYAMKKADADNACLSAQLDPYPGIQPDNMM